MPETGWQRLVAEPLDVAYSIPPCGPPIRPYRADERRGAPGIRGSGTAVSVIPFGINNSVPDTDLTTAAAKRRLGIKPGEKTILFFGSIRPYKGLEYLVEAFLRLAATDPSYRLIIAGEAKRDSGGYLRFDR